MNEMIKVENLTKTFTLHQQGGVKIRAVDSVSFSLFKGECLALTGPSGAGKSTLLRCLYGNYLLSEGRVTIRHRGEDVELASAAPQKILEMRDETLGYVSQFLRVIPRVSALDIVAEPLTDSGHDSDDAKKEAAGLLKRLNIPKRLWNLAPATFSGGEQQRVNIARGFIKPSPVLLLDEPTASLDSANRRVVRELIDEAKQSGAAVIGIFHDEEIRGQVADREHRLTPPNGQSEVKG